MLPVRAATGLVATATSATGLTARHAEGPDKSNPHRSNGDNPLRKPKRVIVVCRNLRWPTTQSSTLRGAVLIQFASLKPILAVAISSIVLLSSVVSPESAHADDVDLRNLLISAEQASSDGISFDRMRIEPYEAATHLSGFGMRQGQRAFYVDTGQQVQLRITLVEFTSNRAANRVRVHETEDTPAGFPQGTRYAVKQGDSGYTAVDVDKGRITVHITLSPLPGDTLTRTTVDAVLRNAMAAQFAQIPMTVDLQSDDVNVSRMILLASPLLAIPLIALWLVVSTTLRDIGTLERVFRSRRRTPTTFQDITPKVRVARHKGVLRTSLQLLAATVLVAALFAIPPLLGLTKSMPGGTFRPLLVPPLTLGLVIAVQSYWASRKASGLPFKREPRWPLFVGTTGAMGVLFAAAYLFLGVVAMLTFIASWPIRLILFAIYVPIGLKVLRYSARPLRFAKQLAAGDVAQTLAADPRQEVLLLRSFQDDSLVVRMHRTARHSPIELASTELFDRFEELIAWSLWRIGPVVAIGQPTTEGHLQPLGAAREFYSDDTWQVGAQTRMRSSSLIVFVVGRSPGLWWEVSNVRWHGLLGKCLFVFPPVDYVELGHRLRVLAGALDLRTDELPAVDSAGRRLIGLHFDDAGRPVLIGVNGRDDLAYQMMFETVCPALVVRKSSAAAAATTAMVSEPSAEVAANLETFDPNRSTPGVPTMSAGLLYLLLMATQRRHNDGR